MAQFQEAIEDLYYFEFVYGELSVQLVCREVSSMNRSSLQAHTRLVCRGVCWLVSACVYCDCLTSFVSNNGYYKWFGNHLSLFCFTSLKRHFFATEARCFKTSWYYTV